MFQLWSNTSEQLPLTDIRPAPLSALFAHWQAIQTAGPAPKLAKLLDGPIHATLNHMALLEITPAGDTAKYLVVGKALIRLLGSDPTGKMVSEVYSKPISTEVNQLIAQIAAKAQPVFHRCIYRILTREFGYYRLMLPVIRHERGAKHIVLAICPTDDAFKEAQQWQDTMREGQELEEIDAGWTAPGRASDTTHNDEDVWYV